MNGQSRPPHDRFGAALRWGSLGSIMLVATVYGLLNMEFAFQFVSRKPLYLWTKFLAAMTSSRFAFGPGSTFSESHETYGDRWWQIMAHSIIGGSMLILGPWQFVSEIRKRRIWLHRWIGWTYYSAQAIVLASAMYMLVTIPPAQYYSGAGFGFATWGFWALTAIGSVFALSAILGHDITQHSAWMAYNFAIIMATPNLRVMWIIGDWICGGQCRNDYINSSGVGIIMPINTYLAAMYLVRAYRAVPYRRPAATVSPRGKLVYYALGAVGALASFLIMHQHSVRYVMASPFDFFKPGVWADRHELHDTKRLMVNGYGALPAMLIAVGWSASMMLGLWHHYDASFIRDDAEDLGSITETVTCTAYYMFSALASVGSVVWGYSTRHVEAYGSDYVFVFWVGLLVLWWIVNFMAILNLGSNAPRYLEWLTHSVAISFVYGVMMILLLVMPRAVAFDQAYKGAATIAFGLCSFVGYYFVVNMHYVQRKAQPMQYGTVDGKPVPIVAGVVVSDRAQVSQPVKRQ